MSGFPPQHYRLSQAQRIELLRMAMDQLANADAPVSSATAASVLRRLALVIEGGDKQMPEAMIEPVLALAIALRDDITA